MSDAKKNDSDKVRVELLSSPALFEIGKVMTFGAKKYEAHNWRKGFEWSRVSGAAMRHLLQWLNPYESDVDNETGLSHLAHLGCCVLFLLEHELYNLGTDDRYEPETETPELGKLEFMPEYSDRVIVIGSGPLEHMVGRVFDLSREEYTACVEFGHSRDKDYSIHWLPWNRLKRC